MEPLINGEAYSWSQIEINIAGVDVVGITSIDYEDQQDIKNIYGAGVNPVSRSKGPIKPTASITVSMIEVERLQKKSKKTGRLQDLPLFDITVAFIPENGTLVKHVIKGCSFTTNSRKVKQGDMEIGVELPLVPSQIKWK